MSKVTAKFSTGEVDVYTGSRNVSAGWAIIGEYNGRFGVLFSGHSMTAKAAASTAKNKLRIMNGWGDKTKFKIEVVPVDA